MDDRLHRSPLHDRHLALGAKFAPFGGWEMPVEYGRPPAPAQPPTATAADGARARPVADAGGVLKEHAAVREAVGLFDVSHLGKARVRGTGAARFVNACLTNDLDRIGPGRAQYTMCCDEATGGVVDDLIAYRYADDHVFLIPNAANTAEVVRRLRRAAPAGITVSDEHRDHAVLAVQGPRSADLLAELGLPTGPDYMSFNSAVFDGAASAGVALTVCRTGYTGEHGYELVVPAEGAGAVWDALLAAGGRYGLRPCGLGARDTLRTEMGYPLHGQELAADITPVQARAGWAVGWNKPEFWGRAALLAERAAGPRRSLCGLTALDRGIPRAHMTVYADTTPVGEVTSGTFSPTLRKGIALALLDTAAGLAEGDPVEVDVRGRRCPMRVTRPPFVPSSVR